MLSVLIVVYRTIQSNDGGEIKEIIAGWRPSQGLALRAADSHPLMCPSLYRGMCTADLCLTRRILTYIYMKHTFVGEQMRTFSHKLGEPRTLFSFRLGLRAEADEFRFLNLI